MKGFELAAHEVGHAVVAYILGAQVKWICIDPARRSGGMEPVQHFSAAQWRQEVLVSLAGEVAQRKITSDPAELVDAAGIKCWMHDAARVSSLINSHLISTRTEAELESDQPFEELLEAAYFAVEGLLGRPEAWTAVMEAASKLVAEGWTLTGEQFTAVVSPLLPDEKKDALTRALNLSEALR